jgi:catechol 2,3-dioxygenase-like lactoylglutathione lyase family enzyme
MDGGRAETAINTWAKRFYAVTLFVDDLAASRSFYADVFQAPIANEDATSCAFRFPGDVYINLVTTDSAREFIEPARVGGEGTPARMMLTLEVADVDAVCDRLLAQGVKLLNGPADRPWGRVATFADPSGHCWELSD